jgi:hypothetical protein
METFQIHYFRDGALEKVESVEAPDLLEVIDRASHPEPAVTAEIWSKIGRVGMIGPLPELDGEAVNNAGPGAEITGVMKNRLRVVRG